MAISFHSQGFPIEIAASLLSTAELASPHYSLQPNDFLGRFRLIPQTRSTPSQATDGILGEIGRYTRQIYRPEIVEQRAQSLLFPQNPITLERSVDHHPDTPFALGACLMFEGVI